jgi:Family of unknown function (DUF5681)
MTMTNPSSTRPTDQEMFDLAYARLVHRFQDTYRRDANYLLQSWAGLTPGQILQRMDLGPAPHSRQDQHQEEKKNVGGLGPKEPSQLGQVGYKRAPLHGRFKPGQSGNPRGRPRNSVSVPVSGLIETIQQNMFNTPISTMMAGKPTKLHPLDAFYRNRQKLAFTGSVLATENAIRDIEERLSKNEKEKNQRIEKTREYINQYPEMLVHIHERRLDAAYCIPHPDYLTINDDKTITIKGPVNEKHLAYYQTVTDYACYLVVRAIYDAFVLRNLMARGKDDPELTMLLVQTDLFKTKLPAHLVNRVLDYEAAAERCLHFPKKLETLYQTVAERTSLPFLPNKPFAMPDGQLKTMMSCFRFSAPFGQ